MRNWILITLLFLSFILSSSCIQKSTRQNEKKQDNFRVIAFCMSDGGEIEKYEIDKLTHLIFCFAQLKGNKISLINSGDEERLKRFVALKAKYPKLKVLVSFGGWGGCETCSDVFNSAGRSYICRHQISYY